MPDVRSSNTPSEMRDRIGLRDSVRASAVVINPPTDGSMIRIFVSDNNAGAGNATINGVREINITVTTQALDVLGTLMTTGSMYLALSYTRGMVVESPRRCK